MKWIVVLLAMLLPIGLDASLIAFYTFEGNANDVSGNGVHGTITGAPSTVTGFEGQAFSFNGSSDFVRIGLDINPGTRPLLTMGAWVRTSVNNPTQQIISHDNGSFDRSLGYDTRGGGGTNWSSFTGAGVLSSGVSVASTLNQWVFVAAVFNQNTSSVTVYTNTSSASASTSLGSGHTFTDIGHNPSFGEFFQGEIDNVFFFDEALDAAAIDNIRLGGANAILGTAIPEPSTYLLCIFSLALFYFRKK